MKIDAIKLVDEYAGRALTALLNIRRRAKPTPAAPERILFVKFWGLGSIVLSTECIRAVRERFPAARVDMLTLAENRDVCDHLDLFDRVHTVRIGRWTAFVADVVSTLAALRRARYDTVVDLELFAYVSALAAAATGAPRRIGFDKGAESLFTDVVHFDPSRHVVESFRALADVLVGGASPVGLSVPVATDAVESVGTMLDGLGITSSDFVVLMNVNASALAVERRWPRDRFAELAARLSHRFGARVVLTGSPSERSYVEGVISSLPGPTAVFNAAGRLGFAELVALVDRADLVVTNDSGPLHLASALDRPTIALFGPETPTRYGPLAQDRLVFYAELACSPCMSVENRKTVNCRYDALCMRSMSADSVWARVEPFVAALRARRRIETARGTASS